MKRRTLRRNTSFIVLLALALTAANCGPGVDVIQGPNPTAPSSSDGGIRGTVFVDGVGTAGIVLNLSTLFPTYTYTEVTDAAGFYQTDVIGLEVTVAIVGYPANVYFPRLTATLGDLEAVNIVDFRGRTVSAIDGTVSADGDALDCVTVTLSAAQVAPTTTDFWGRYRLTHIPAGIPAGQHTVTISDFPSDVLFDAQMKTVTVDAGMRRTVDFEGVRSTTATFRGTLRVDSDALPPHDPVVFSAGSGKDNVEVKVTRDTGFVIEGVSGFAPTALPRLNGAIDASGAFMASGTMTVNTFAGTFSDVNVEVTGPLSSTGVLSATITVGGNGALPKPDGSQGADPVVYNFTGALQG